MDVDFGSNKKIIDPQYTRIHFLPQHDGKIEF